MLNEILENKLDDVVCSVEMKAKLSNVDEPRIVVVGDLHFGSKYHDMLCYTFEKELVGSDVVNSGDTFVVFLGDVFHRVVGDARMFDDVLRLFGKLENIGGVLFVTGNHDVNLSKKFNSLSILEPVFDSRGIPVHISEKPELVEISFITENGVRKRTKPLCCLPYTFPDNSDLSTREKFNSLVCVKNLDALCVVGHFTTEEFFGVCEELPEEFVENNRDRLLLGHIHTGSSPDKRLAYSGSFVPVNLLEAHSKIRAVEEKKKDGGVGYWVLEDTGFVFRGAVFKCREVVVTVEAKELVFRDAVTGDAVLCEEVIQSAYAAKTFVLFYNDTFNSKDVLRKILEKEYCEGILGCVFFDIKDVMLADTDAGVEAVSYEGVRTVDLLSLLDSLKKEYGDSGKQWLDPKVSQRVEAVLR